VSSVVILILFAPISGDSDDSDCPEEKVPDIAAGSEVIESGKDAWVFIFKTFSDFKMFLGTPSVVMLFNNAWAGQGLQWLPGRS